MQKPFDPAVSFVYDLPANHRIDGVWVDNTGWVAFLDKDGMELDVTGVQRLVTHERRKGPKVRTRQALAGVRLSVDGLQELCNYHEVFVIDTSYTYHPTRYRHALACSIRLQFMPEGEQVRVHVDDKLVYYDLMHAEGNPERAGMLALALEHSNTLGDLALKRALVTDSDLGLHDAINARTMPLYGEVLLPPNFTLLYASGDTGTEATNRILAFCDKQAKATLRDMIAGNVPPPERRERIRGAGELLLGRLVQKDVQATETLLGRMTGFETATLILEGDDGRQETIEVKFPPVS
ncbi:hypothetical protein [Polaromonas sp. YR568]|uniref:hypothetical protein n=1 Tax=Polaromonas sp. YR568 TaxID=1855301 RepID=UPI00398C1141